MTIERIAASTLLETDEQVLDDAAVDEVFAQTSAVADVWRDRLNASLPEAQRVQTVVLDYEFKTMAAGWPHLVDGADPYPGTTRAAPGPQPRPGLRAVARRAVSALPIPRDVLMRAALVETVTCTDRGASRSSGSRC